MLSGPVTVYVVCESNCSCMREIDFIRVVTSMKWMDDSRNTRVQHFDTNLF
jgi:hypothetical protein